MSELGRKDIQITLEEAQALLKVSECGILSTFDTDGQPYGVPLNYVYINEAIYFHCAWLGHNIDNNPQVSLCVVGYSEVLPVDFSTNYRSTVVFGVASEVEGKEWNNCLIALLGKYPPDYFEEGRKEIEKLDNVTKVIKVDIQQINGKKISHEA